MRNFGEQPWGISASGVIAGLLVANTLIALVAALGFSRSVRNRRLHRAMSVGTAAFSLVLGLTLVTGQETGVPSLLAG